jgi:enamine deaminase RidA (YjgF/YER057c/UK114 family)
MRLVSCLLSWARAGQAGRVDIDQRLRELGIELPAPMMPVGNYVAAVVAGDLIFVSGTGPVRADGSLVTGKVGEGGLSLETAREAARLNGLQILAVLRAELGDLGRVRRVVKVFGWLTACRGSTRLQRSSTAAPTCWLRCSATPDGERGPRWGWPNCHLIFRLRLRPSSRFPDTD